MNVRNAKEIAIGLTGLPIFLLNTHADRDHIGSNEQFEEFHMHPAEEALYRSSGKTEAEALGRGGATEISKIFNIHQNTLTAGKKDLHTGEVLFDKSRDNIRTRREGAGRKTIQEKYPGVIDALNKLVDSDSFGNPENPLRWTTVSRPGCTVSAYQ